VVIEARQIGAAPFDVVGWSLGAVIRRAPPNIRTNAFFARSEANHQILTRTRSDEAAPPRSHRSFVGPPISAVNAEPTASLRRYRLRLTLNHVVERLVYIGGWL
jgi:hypothetical protein